jgi:uncharacterized protein YfeS
MKVYYEVYINAKIKVNGKLVDGNKLALTTKSRAKAFQTLNRLIKWDDAKRKYSVDGFIDEITDYGDGNETVDTIA